ncbi:hypothetical protein [Desulfobulbus elongatus]|uniref:hypothetical protein n=1 Tax=Desulfobulbus elongatus TaxID=53332 RepID=UPI0004839056|nr:hypothetical protein [Desulfobulbus elongatus]
MKRNKKPHINSMIYDGDFSLHYDCAGEVSCAFALCEIMPPDEESICCFRDHGSCRNIAAQKAAIEGLRRRLQSALKQLEDEDA